VPSFYSRFLRTAKPNTKRHLIETCEAYMEAVVEEARLRENGEVADLDNFIRLRRENSAVRCCFALIAYGLKIDFPMEVFEDPVANETYLSAIDMVCWANVSGNLPYAIQISHTNFVLRTSTLTTWNFPRALRGITSSLC